MSLVLLLNSRLLNTVQSRGWFTKVIMDFDRIQLRYRCECFTQSTGLSKSLGNQSHLTTSETHHLYASLLIPFYKPIPFKSRLSNPFFIIITTATATIVVVVVVFKSFLVFIHCYSLVRIDNRWIETADNFSK